MATNSNFFFGLMTITLCVAYEASAGVIGHSEIPSAVGNVNIETTSNGDDNEKTFDQIIYKNDDDLRETTQESVLKKTNFYRTKHGLDPLVLDDNMNNFAQKWADHLKGNGLSHRPDNAYGENLYATTDANNVGEKAVSAWYDEIKYYDPNDDENQLFARSAMHHMTQLLWKSSKIMGVGVSKGENGWYTVVANYDPPGNVGGYFKENMPIDLCGVFKNPDYPSRSTAAARYQCPSNLTQLWLYLLIFLLYIHFF